ncbi:MAG: hypothetical protein MK052_04880 [Alphaproteobacteria bacterium]|nr:hypothetical protein [Alphaproteobacteria bacterium]
MATAQQQIRDLKSEVKELSNLVEKQAKTLNKEIHGNGHYHITRDELRSMAENAGASAREFVSDKRAKASAYAGQYEDTVGAHPWKSTALAVAGGLVLGAILRRRH